jgi:hypothetical protein
MALGPRLLRRREAAAMAEEKFREPMPGSEEIRADVFPAAEEIPRRFFVFGGNMNRG